MNEALTTASAVRAARLRAAAYKSAQALGNARRELAVAEDDFAEAAGRQVLGEIDEQAVAALEARLSAWQADLHRREAAHSYLRAVTGQ